MYRLGFLQNTIVEEELLCFDKGRLSPIYSIHNGQTAFDQARLGSADIDYLMVHFSLDLPLLSLAESRSIPYLDVAYKQLTSGLNFDDCSAQLDKDGLRQGLKNPKFHSFLLSCFASLGYQVKNIVADEDGVKLIKINWTP